MRLDGKSNAYINAAYDIAKDKVNGRKTVNDSVSVFNVIPEMDLPSGAEPEV